MNSDGISPKEGRPRKAPRSRKNTLPDTAPAWEARHDDDARGPLADNSSDLPDRAAGLGEGTPGAAPAVHGSGFQLPADAVHPNFPDQEVDAAGTGRQPDQEAVRQRAYQIWEQEGKPEGGHERHWIQAEHELRGERS